MKNGILVFLIFVGFATSAFSQSNDNCADAIILSVGTECKASVYSNANASSESETVSADPSCGLYKGGDVWFATTMPSSGALRIETTNLSGPTTHSVTVYSGSCGAFTEVECMRQDGARTISQPSLAGESIYLRVFSLNGAAGSAFELCVYEPTIPDNDLCKNALLLDVGSTCTMENFSNAFATAEGTSNAADPSCDAFLGGDIWFKTIMPASGQLRINKNRGSGVTPPAMTIYSGNCGNFEELLCSKNDATETLNAPSLAGEMIYLRLYSYYNEEGFSFSFCLYEEAAPGNDNCKDAIGLAVGASCEMKDFTNLQASTEPESTAPTPSCGSYKGADVWFNFNIPASGKLRLETDIASGSAPRSLTLYKGTCGNFEEIACMSIDYEETFYLPDLRGEIVYLRAFSLNSDDGGPFSLCAFEPNTSSNDDCANAIEIPTNLQCTPQTYSNAFALAEEERIAANPSCGHFQGGDVWFRTTVPASGDVRIHLENLEGAIDKSVTVYSGSCGAFSEITCSQLSNYVFVHEPMLAGENIYIRVFSYGSKEGSDFTICSQEYNCEPHAVDAGEKTLCEGEIFTFGTQLITQAGEYTETFLSKSGCDSLVTISLTMSDIDTTVIQTGSTLSANETEAAYQWVDCDKGFEPLFGETKSSFTAATPGNYAVLLIQNSCIDTSACINTLVLGLPDDKKNNYILYPNPVKDILTLTPAFPQYILSANLISVKGTMFKSWGFQKQYSYSLDIRSIPSGLYFLKIYAPDGVIYKKVIKE